MKLLTYIDDSGQHRPGVVLDASGTGEAFLLDLRQAAAVLSSGDDALFASLQSMLESPERSFELARRALDDAGRLPESARRPVRRTPLAAPLPRPRSLRDCLAFERHLIQCMRTVTRWKSRPLAALDSCLERVFGRGLLRPPSVWYRRPLYYKGNPASVVGHEADVLWPSFTQKLDFELEFAVVIGRRGVNIPAERAREYVAGYLLFNDFSARDVQFDEMAGRLGPAKSKDFDTGNSLGPWLVTPDAVPDPLTLSVRVNGEEWGRGSSEKMQFRIEDIIAYISRDETLYPGDVIGSGTVPGCCGLELDRWIQPGDTIELDAEGIGVLRNRVIHRTGTGDADWSCRPRRLTAETDSGH